MVTNLVTKVTGGAQKGAAPAVKRQGRLYMHFFSQL